MSTCPASTDFAAHEYAGRVAEVARWSEAHGCSATLVYSDNRLVDPWMVSQILVRETERLVPLVAIQPVYMHPYTVATLVASFGQMFGRRLYLNMVAGGFRNDLKALDDRTPHDRRYERLVEYTRIVKDLLAGETVTFDGHFYRVFNLSLNPPLPPELFPDIFVSGSSEAGRSAAERLEARPVAYPQPAGEQPRAPVPWSRKPGLRVGIIAREDSAEAWRIAHERFPPDRRGQMVHRLARKVSDSVWHRELSRMAERRAAERDPYWLVPFENYRTMCPYLVGSYGEVRTELARYVALGFQTFLLDIPRTEEDLVHATTAFRTALDGAPV